MIVTLASVALLAAPPSAQPLDLAAAIARARSHNEGAQQARARVRAAAADVDAAWAALYPTATLGATWRLNDRTVKVGERTVQALTSANAELSLGITLFEGRALSGLDQAEARAQAARAAAAWDVGAIEFAVADAWYAAVSGLSLRKAAERTLNSATENLEVVQARREVGKALAVDEARARLRVVSAQEAVTRAATVEASTRDLLGLLVHADGPVEVGPPPAPPAVDAHPGAVDARADLQALTRLAEATALAVEDAWLDFLPSLSVLGRYAATSDGGFGGQQTAGALFLTAEWLLYDPARGPRQAREAAEARHAELELRYRTRESRFAVRQARRDLDAVQASIATAAQRLELARQTRSQVLERYRAGRATSLELVEAEDTLRGAELDDIARTLDLYRARLGLLRALGLDPLGQALEETP